jgi:hypothetical protein
MDWSEEPVIEKMLEKPKLMVNKLLGGDNTVWYQAVDRDKGVVVYDYGLDSVLASLRRRGYKRVLVECWDLDTYGDGSYTIKNWHTEWVGLKEKVMSSEEAIGETYKLVKRTESYR